MHRNSMTGEPNQQNPTPLFVGFNAFSSTNSVSGGPLHLPTINQQTQYFNNVPVPDSFIETANTSFTGAQPSLRPSVQPTHFNHIFNKPPDAPLGQFQFGPPVSRQSIQATDHNVVQFPFPTTIPFDNKLQMPLRCKRKTDSLELPASKKHITEEKMAEHMSKLHISSETQTSPNESESTKTKRLYMCEEMRKLQPDSILPQCLLNRIQRPCTDLVLWTPPERILLRPFEDQQQNESNNNNNNNNEVVTMANDFMENELEVEME